MTTQEQYVERLKEMVVVEFGRPIATTEDCVALSDAVLECVGVGVDIESLEQLFILNTITPRPLILSSLARYVGFTGWSDFCTARDVIPADDRDKLPVVRRWGIIILTALAVVVVLVSAIMLISRDGGDTDDALVVDSRFRNIEAKWLASTSERCNTLRTFYNEDQPQRFNDGVDRYIVKYSEFLTKSVKSDVESYVVQYKITVDNDTIDQTTEIIIEKCLKMVEDIKID